MASTIKDIAHETGLSIATVSKYINGGHLREKNRIAIKDAIRRLDYQVNEYARGLKSNRSKTIGIIIPELCNLVRHSNHYRYGGPSSIQRLQHYCL